MSSLHQDDASGNSKQAPSSYCPNTHNIKVAEEFVIKELFKPITILEVLDPDHFGFIAGSSTGHAIIKLFHKWTETTDGNGSTVRLVFIDYQKAFDFIGHSILVSKLKLLRILIPTLNWIIKFLPKPKTASEITPYRLM